MNLAEKLNKYECQGQTSRGGVTLVVAPQDDSLFDSDDKVVDPAFAAFLDEERKFKVWVDQDPRGGDGLVFCVEDAAHGDSAWFNPSENKWVKG